MSSSFALDAILLQALQNPKDRAFILGSEKTCESLFHPSLQYDTCLLMFRIRKAQFPPMNSYFRMMMHRIARYYGLIHLADSKTGVVTLTVSNDSRLPLISLSELVEREDLFSPVLKCSDGSSVSSDKKEESSPSNVVKNKVPEDGMDGIASPEVASSSVGEAKEEQASVALSVDEDSICSRVHYSESTTDVDVPRHILQLNISDKAKFVEDSARQFAAARLNAELRADGETVLLIFQSCTAAARALSADPFKTKFEASLERWTPQFFPTSMF